MIPSRWFGFLLAWLNRCDWRIALVGAWAVFLLFPVWKTGWVYDDMYNSSLPGLWIYRDWSPAHDALADIKDWTFTIGRINPLAHILIKASFWTFRDLFWYKTALVGGVLVNLFVFYRLLKRLGASPDLAALCCFLGVTFIQFRVFEDPVFAFHGLMQWLFLGTLLSLGAFHRYLTGGRIGWLALSFLFYLATALTYEMTYLFWLLHAGLFLTTPGRWSRAAAVAPFAAVVIVLALGSVWLHPSTGDALQPYGMNLKMGVVADATLKQVAGALPGSYPILFRKAVVPVLRDVFSWKTLSEHPAVLAFGFAVAAILTTGIVRRGCGEPSHWRRLLVLGLLLAVLPAPVLAVARKYQLILRYGLAYLPVYIEYFGVALLFTCCFGFLAARVRPGGWTAKAFVGAVGLFCAAVAVFHSETNNRVVAALRQPYLTPRREVEELLERGRLLKDVSAGATLLVDGFPWDTYGAGNFFYSYHTKTRLNSVICPGAWDAPKMAELVTKPGAEEAPNVLRVRYTETATEHGWVVAGTLRHLNATAAGDVSQSEISQLHLAVRRGWRMGPDRPFVLHATYLSPIAAEPAQFAAISPEQMQRTAVTKNWTVYDVKIPFPYVEGESMWLEFKPPTAGAALTTRTIKP